GTDEQRAAWLPGLAAGDTVAAWCPVGFSVRQARGDAVDHVVARQDGDGFVLNGRVPVVQDGRAADVLLVTAVAPTGPVQVLVRREEPGVDVVDLECLDLARRLAEIHMADVRMPAAAVLPVDGAAAAIERQCQLAVVLQCAESVGVAERALELTVEYARDRIAFGRPIGSYQA